MFFFLLGCSNASDYQWYYEPDAYKYQYGPENQPEENNWFVTVFHYEFKLAQSPKRKPQHLYPIYQEDIKYFRENKYDR